MNRNTRLHNWLLLSRAEQFRTLEAAFLLTAAWFTVRLLPFRWYALLMGQCGAATPDTEPCAADTEAVARDVGRGLRRADRHLPWRSTCLMRALAGKIMLRRRRCPGTVFVGVAQGDGAEFDFHAWLRAGAVWVSGRQEAPRFTVVATFR